MTLIRPTYVDTVTRIPADWANAVTALLFDVFALSATPSAARQALGIGTLGEQDANNVQIVGGSINDTPIGIIGPAQGRFSVLAVDNNPIAPTQVVNKRYLDSQLQGLSDNYLSVRGGTLQGSLTLANDPVTPMDAVPQRYVVNTLRENVVDRPIQRHRWIASAGQTDFVWPDWVRPVDAFADNFVMFRSGAFMQHTLDYAVLLSAQPKITLQTPATAGQIIDAMYLDNLNNLQAIPTVSPTDPFSAAPAWSDPINLRIGYQVGNFGQNSIQSSSTMLRHLFMSSIVLVGDLGDKQISWMGTWMPANSGAAAYPPTIIAVSGTEAVVTLPENVVNNEFFWEGRYEITMYVDGVAAQTRLWCDMNNQLVPNLKDGLVRWGVVDGAGNDVILPITLTNAIDTVCATTAVLLIDAGARQTFQLGTPTGTMSLTFTNAGTDPKVVIAPQTPTGLVLPNGWSEAFPVVPAGGTKTITAAYVITAVAPQDVVFDFVDCPGQLTVALTA